MMFYVLSHGDDCNTLASSSCRHSPTFTYVLKYFTYSPLFHMHFVKLSYIVKLFPPTTPKALRASLRAWHHTYMYNMCTYTHNMCTYMHSIIRIHAHIDVHMSYIVTSLHTYIACARTCMIYIRTCTYIHTYIRNHFPPTMPKFSALRASLRA